MNRERWEQLQELFHKTMQLDPEKRRAFLDQHCSSDLELRRELEEMLAAERDLRSSFLEAPALQQVAVNPTKSFIPGVMPSGKKLGPYEIIALIGSGGMGEVYRARDTRLDRTVAVKVIPAHLSSDPERRQRFEREARAISALQPGAPSLTFFVKGGIPRWSPAWGFLNLTNRASALFER